MGLSKFETLAIPISNLIFQSTNRTSKNIVLYSFLKTIAIVIDKRLRLLSQPKTSEEHSIEAVRQSGGEFFLTADSKVRTSYMPYRDQEPSDQFFS